MPALRRDRDGGRAMTPAEPDPPEERIVPMIRVRCDQCRRARARYFANQLKGGLGLPKMERPVPVCPHYETQWAPGHGPGNPPPEDSEWDRTPPV